MVNICTTECLCAPWQPCFPHKCLENKASFLQCLDFFASFSFLCWKYGCKPTLVNDISANTSSTRLSLHCNSNKATSKHPYWFLSCIQGCQICQFSAKQFFWVPVNLIGMLKYSITLPVSCPSYKTLEGKAERPETGLTTLDHTHCRLATPPSPTAGYPNPLQLSRDKTFLGQN